MLLTILLLISVYQSVVHCHLWWTCSFNPWGRNPFQPNPGCYLPFSLSWCLLWWCKVDGKQNCGYCPGPWWSLYFSLSQTHNTRRQKPASLSWWSSINYFSKSWSSVTSLHCSEWWNGCFMLSIELHQEGAKMLVSRKHQQVEGGELNLSIFSGKTVFFKRLKTMVTYTWIFGRNFSQNEKESLKLGKTADRICCQG